MHQEPYQELYNGSVSRGGSLRRQTAALFCVNGGDLCTGLCGAIVLMVHLKISSELYTIILGFIRYHAISINEEENNGKEVATAIQLKMSEIYRMGGEVILPPQQD